MNYLAHGYRFLDQPIFLAGTAVPDWLRVSDPRVRARAKLTAATLENSDDEPFQQLCRGILQHHADDDLFHASIVFQQISEQLATSFRLIMPDCYDHRPGILGHIVTELLLDNELARRDPTLLPRYYKALDFIESEWIQSAVNRIVRKPAYELSRFVDIFCDVQFLYDYAANSQLLYRLNQVFGRAQLEPLNEKVFGVFDEARELLRVRSMDLLEFTTAG